MSRRGVPRAQRARAPRVRGAATRERLLDAAYVLFAEKGYAATSTAQICRRAGAVKTALYWHFDSKEGLLAAARRARRARAGRGDPEERVPRRRSALAARPLSQRACASSSKSVPR